MAGYKRIAWSVVVAEDDAETYVEQLNVAMDKLEEHTTVFAGGMSLEDVPAPPNAGEIKNGTAD